MGAHSRLHDDVEIPPLLARGRWLNIAVKLLLVVLLAAAVPLAGTFDPLEGKGMVGRAMIFWVPAALLPAAWLALGRRVRYPHLPDALIVAPFLVDVLGNYLDLYAGTDWFDVTAHFVNWILLCTGVGALLLALPLGRLTVAALTVGFGAFAKIIWELGEYVALLLGVAGLGLNYVNTMHDMAAGLAGALVAVALVALVLWPASRGGVRG